MMKKISIIADEVVDALLRAKHGCNDPEFKTIWAQKVAEVARRKGKHHAKYHTNPHKFT